MRKTSTEMKSRGGIPLERRARSNLASARPSQKSEERDREADPQNGGEHRHPRRSDGNQGEGSQANGRADLRSHRSSRRFAEQSDSRVEEQRARDEPEGSGSQREAIVVSDAANPPFNQRTSCQHDADHRGQNSHRLHLALLNLNVRVPASLCCLDSQRRCAEHYVPERMRPEADGGVRQIPALVAKDQLHLAPVGRTKFLGVSAEEHPVYGLTRAHARAGPMSFFCRAARTMRSSRLASARATVKPCFVIR